ncbi:MAG TPA: hypothetical protein VMU85_12500 [Stellaceae bacterium]|nr:hypothetical protein [Stellaceae bacterium]
MPGNRSYALLLLAGCAAVVLSYVLACIVIDPYGVFNLFAFSQHNPERSLRYAKTAYIAEHCGEYRGILFGNSRSLQFSERDLQTYFEEPVFNFSVQADALPGIEEKLDWLLPRCPFKDAILVVDAQMLLARPLDQGLFLREHYLVSDSNRLEFFAPFLMVPPKIVIKTGLELLQGALTAPPPGSRPELVADAAVRTGILPVQRACYAPDPVNLGVYRANLAAFQQVIERLKAAGRSVRVIVAPLNQNLLARFDYRAVADAVSDVVATAGGAAVFTGYNALALDDDLYMDVGHFNGATAALLLQIASTRERRAPLMGWYSGAEAAELRDLLIANGERRAAACGTLMPPGPRAPRPSAVSAQFLAQ